MADAEYVKEELMRKIRQCLRDAGVETEADLSEHEAVIHGKLESEGHEELRVVVHITDREVQPGGAGSADRELVKARLAVADVRPTLAHRSAAGAASEQGPDRGY